MKKQNLEESAKPRLKMSHKSFNQLNMKQFPSFKTMIQYTSLSFSDNPIDSFKTLHSLPMLKYLELNNTRISSFQYTQPQPLLENLNLKNTQISNYPHFQLMAAIVFGKELKILNGSRISPHILRKSSQLRADLYPYLFNGWIIINDKPIILFNTTTRQRKKFMNGNIPKIEIERITFEDGDFDLSNLKIPGNSTDDNTEKKVEDCDGGKIHNTKRKSLETPSKPGSSAINDKLTKSMPRLPTYPNHKPKKSNKIDSNKSNALIPRRNATNAKLSKTPTINHVEQRISHSTLKKPHSLKVDMELDENDNNDQLRNSHHTKNNYSARTLVSTPRSIIKGQCNMRPPFSSEVKKATTAKSSTPKSVSAIQENDKAESNTDSCQIKEEQENIKQEAIVTNEEIINKSSDDVNNSIKDQNEINEDQLKDNSVNEVIDNFEILSDVLSDSMSSSLDDFIPPRQPVTIQMPQDNSHALEGQPTLNEMFRDVIGHIPDSDISSFTASDATSVSEFISDAALDKELDDLRSISSTDMSSDAFMGSENDFTYSNNYVPKRSQFRRNSRTNSPSKRRRRTYFVQDRNADSILLD